MPAPTPVIVSEDQKSQLNEISKAATSSQREAFRARIILGLASGKSAEAVAKELNTSMPSVSKWRGRWSRQGFAGLRDAAGRGRKASVSPKAVGKALTMAPTRAAHGGGWSVREMAAHTGLSKSTVQRLWAAHGIAPHRIRGFKLSNDLEFEEKYWDVVGLLFAPSAQRRGFVL
jgi:transposase